MIGGWVGWTVGWMVTGGDRKCLLLPLGRNLGQRGDEVRVLGRLRSFRSSLKVRDVGIRGMGSLGLCFLMCNQEVSSSWASPSPSASASFSTFSCIPVGEVWVSDPSSSETASGWFRELPGSLITGEVGGLTSFFTPTVILGSRFLLGPLGSVDKDCKQCWPLGDNCAPLPHPALCVLLFVAPSDCAPSGHLKSCIPLEAASAFGQVVSTFTNPSCVSL